MPDRADESPRAARHELSEEVGAREVRKVRARRSRDRTIVTGVGMFGIVGWAVAVPTLIGILLGTWFDRRWPGPFSWTLALLLGGVALGCISAWHWISLERQAIEEEERETQ